MDFSSSQLFKPGWAIVLFLTIFSVGISFVAAKGGFTLGLLLVSLVVAAPIVVLLLTNIKFGFFTLLISSYFMSFISRMTEGLVPMLVLEIMMFMVFTGFIIMQIRTHRIGVNAKYLRHPITVAILIWTVYTHLQLFNPNSSGIMGKLIAIRFCWYNLIGFIIAMNVFDSVESIKQFFKILLGMALLAALYGLSQKYIGLLPYDHEWLFSSPERMSLGVIFGNVRAWSFLNDPANFGILMAFCGIVCLVLTLGPYTFRRKIVLMIMGITMLLAMVTSGTRTAFVMVPFGFAVFGLLTINNFKTILFSSFILLIFAGIYFGPFYSTPINRIRSAFQGNDDPSMNVRSENKRRIQPYIWTHPIGGSPGTTGEEGKVLAPGHVLAGFPPDSGYLKIALEYGYAGLMLLLWHYYVASSKGVYYFFRARDREIKALYLTTVVSFIALCTANLTQLSSAMRPFDFFTFSFFAILIRMQEFDRPEG